MKQFKSDAVFSAMDIPPRLYSAMESMGLTEPTEIQARAIPIIRAGRDLIGQSQTGTGKTVAFAVPALEKIDPEDERVQVLVLCPTRELAQQCCEQFKKLSRFMMHIYPVDVYGGAAMQRQIQRLRRANLVIGTPGRVMDHMNRRTLRLDGVKLVILDEADEMLSMGFREDIETILQQTPEERQTVLFSATMPPEIRTLTQTVQKDPEWIEVNGTQMTIDAIEQHYIEVPMGRKLDALGLLLRTRAPRRAMVFCNTKAQVDEVATHLMQNGFFADGLHGDLLQSQRNKIMEGFRNGQIEILVATDVAARGIDVRDVDYVFNYDIPQDPDYYIHRIGRTGRAGRSGTAITICSGHRQLETIMRLAHTVQAEITPIPLPGSADAAQTITERVLSETRQALTESIRPEVWSWIRTLKDRGYTTDQIAAAALQLHFGASIPTENEQFSVSAEGGYRWLRLNIGRSSHVAPSHLVAAVAECTGIPGREIGKIEIYDDYALVAVPAAQAYFCAEQMQGRSICGKAVNSTLTNDSVMREKDPRPSYGMPAKKVSVPVKRQKSEPRPRSGKAVASGRPRRKK